MKVVWLPLILIMTALMTFPVMAKEKSTFPIVNGMVLDIGGLQHVEVRLKSLGTGFCSTTVTLGSGSKARRHNLSAPPHTWSRWYKLNPAVAGIGISLSMSENCSTNVIGQVRFFAR